MTDDITARLIGDIRQLISDMTDGHVASLPVFDDFYDGVTITDSTGKICYINDVQLKIDDFDRQSVVGRYVFEVYRVDEGLSPTMQCLKSGEPLLNLACFYRTHYGKMVNSIHNIFPLPVSAIDRIKENTLYLKLDKKAVESWPSKPVRRPC